MAFETGTYDETDDFWNVDAPAPDAGGGHLAGIGTTIGVGRSITPEQYQAQIQAAVASGVPEAYATDFLSRNPGDSNRIVESYESELKNRGGGSSAPAVGSGGPQSIQPYNQPFAFDASKLGQSEGFKFRYDKAIDAIKKAGAARGTYYTPQLWKAIESEASGLAAQETDAEFGRQAGTWDRNFGAYTWGEENRFNSQRANRLDDWSFMDADRRFNRGVLESDRDFGYRQTRDTADDTWRFIDYGYGAARNPR